MRASPREICPASIVGTPPSVVGTPPSAMEFPPSVVGTPPSAMEFPPSVVGTPPSVMGFPPSMTGVCTFCVHAAALTNRNTQSAPCPGRPFRIRFPSSVQRSLCMCRSLSAFVVTGLRPLRKASKLYPIQMFSPRTFERFCSPVTKNRGALRDETETLGPRAWF